VISPELLLIGLKHFPSPKKCPSERSPEGAQPRNTRILQGAPTRQISLREKSHSGAELSTPPRLYPPQNKEDIYCRSVLLNLVKWK
jgi:hypothetical protein